MTLADGRSYNQRMTIFHGARRHEAAAQFGGSPDDFLDFSANINPLPFPCSLAAALTAALPSIRHYPDSSYRALTAALAGWLQVPADALALGNGTAELIYTLLRVLAPAQVVTIEPTFTEYAQAARLAGIPVQALALHPDNGFTLDPAQLTPLLMPNAMVFLGHPVNPTGILYPPPVITALRACCAAHRATLVLDEAFIDFTAAPAAASLAAAAAGDERLIVLRALTKFFAIPGLRVGALVATPAVAAQLRAQLPPWNVNCLAEAAILHLLADREWQQASWHAAGAARAPFVSALAALPALAAVYPPAANFVLARLRPAFGDSGRLYDYLGRRQLLIRSCRDFPGLDGSFFRAAIRSPQDNQALLTALTEYPPI